MPGELILFLLFVLFGVVSTALEQGKQKGRGTGGAPPGPRRLPDGRIQLPDGRIVGPPADPGPILVPWPPPQQPQPGPAAASREESSSEGAAGDAETLETVPEFESVSLEPVGTRSWEATAAAARPAPVRAVLEQSEVDWEAEHQRFHQRYVEGAPPPPRRASDRLAALRGPGALRAAVLAAEILGPPRALRPLDEG